MICPECFHDLPDGSHDCRHCGTVFAQWGDDAAGDSTPATKGGGKGRARPGGKGVKAAPRSRFRRRLAWLAVLGFLGALTWLILEPPLRTVLRPGTVVFASRRDGNPELYVMRSSGLEPRRL